MLISGCQSGSPSVRRFVSSSPSRMAVIGRQKTSTFLLFQEVIIASAIAMLARPKSRALSPMFWTCASAMP